MKTNQTKPDRGQDASIAARERKERIEPRFVLFSLRSLCSFAAFLLLLLSAGSALAALRYVDVNSTNATPPYTSWATSAATIQAAVDAAAPGDEIVVTNGTYATGGRAVGPEFMTNRVTVDKPLTLRSVNGPQVTIIQGAKAPGGGNGEGAIRCVYLADGASLSGFTLTNGATRTDGATDLNQSGGGVWCGSTNAVLTNCVLAGNSAEQKGGGASGGTLYHCTLSGNSAWWGGGVWIGTLHNCVLTGNSAKSQGGGANMGTLHNCVLTGNSANSGGGVSGGTLVNCTVTGNSAESGGGADGYGEYGYVKCSLRNCIVYFNRAPKGANYSKWTTFDYSCTTPLPPGPGNIAADPQLASATHLSPNSPCIGVGHPAYASGVDIDGEPWASPPAMGADQPRLATGPLSLKIDAGFTNVATDYAVSFTAWDAGCIRQSVWDFGDGTLLTNQPFASHAWTAAGAYTVWLVGYNDSFPGGVTASVVMTVSEAVYYVNAASTNPVFPYASWETAARNIQEAIGAGTLPGRSVLVTNGAYRLETVKANGQNRVALTNRVVLRSVNGPAVTVIEGEANGVRCAYVGAGSVLSGFTLTKGTTASGVGDDLIAHGGGAWCESFGVVTNCVLTGNSAIGQGGGVSGGSLYHCTLTGNSAYYGGGADRGTLHNCTLWGNSAEASGGGADGATLYNCTLTGNSAVSGGGAVWSTLKNCIVYSNQARAQQNEANHSESAFEYCCTTPLPTNGVGNIDADPRFVNATIGDFRLRLDSPCIDAGTNLTTPIATDLLGLPRTLDGNGDGIARVDMGAYEFNPYRFEPALELTSDGLVFTVRGEPGKSVRIERSRDLVTWELVATVPIPASGQTLIDPTATTEPFLFYRAVSVP